MKPTEYKNIIQTFLEGALPVEKFVQDYLDAFLSDPGTDIDKPLFDILEDLFEDIEAYSPMWHSEEEGPFRITEESLRREAAETLMNLERYLLEHPG